MKKEKRKIIITILIVVSIVAFFSSYKNILNKEELPKVKLQEIKDTESFAIMVPNDSGDGYEEYKSEENKWPGEDYYFERAECINNNGQKLENVITYNKKSNTVMLETNESVYCALYFDKYAYMKISLHEISYKNSTLNLPEYMSPNIKNIYFVSNIDLSKSIESWDLSDTTLGTNEGTIMAWTEAIDNDLEYYNLYIGCNSLIKVKTLYKAFYVGEYDNLPISSLETIDFNNKLDTSECISLNATFADNIKLKDIKGLESWDVSNVIDMYCLFLKTSFSNLEQIKDWNVSNVQNMRGVFFQCLNITNLNGLEKWDLSNTNNIKDMFSGCSNLIDISALKDWKISSVENMQSTFVNCTKLSNIESLRNWDVSKVTDMFCLFLGTAISNFEPIKNWNVSNVQNMRGMFMNCLNLVNINLSNWQTNSLTNVKDMFKNDSNLRNINLQNATFNQISETINYENMFYNVPANATLIVKDNTQKKWIQDYPKFAGAIQVVN